MRSHIETPIVQQEAVLLNHPASAPARARLVASWSYLPAIEPELLDELHDLLRRFSPTRIAQAMEQACALLVEEGSGPEWPDDGAADAYLAVLSGLLQLSETQACLSSAA